MRSSLSPGLDYKLKVIKYVSIVLYKRLLLLPNQGQFNSFSYYILFCYIIYNTYYYIKLTFFLCLEVLEVIVLSAIKFTEISTKAETKCAAFTSV